MSYVAEAVKKTDNKHLNIFELDAVQRNGNHFNYQIASRAKSVEELTCVSGNRVPNAVAIFAISGNDEDLKVVLIRQFRYPINGYIYELPAGLIDNGETVQNAAIREFFEETGMQFHPSKSDISIKPYFSSPGMTDERVCIVTGTFSGIPTNINQEGSEDIQVVLANRTECARILAEEDVDIRTACMLIPIVSWR